VLEDAVGVNGDNAIGQLAQVPNVLMSHIVGHLPFLAIPCFINTEHERPSTQSLA